MTIALISALDWRQEGWYVSNFRAKTENQSRPKVGTKNVTGLMRPFESLSKAIMKEPITPLAGHSVTCWFRRLR